MPTSEQMDRVTSAIEILTAGLYVVSLAGESVIPAAPGQEGGYYFWDDLSETQKPDALKVAIDWTGFTESQKDGVINRVLEGHDSEHWMDGVDVDSDRSIRPLTQQLIECCQLDVWPGRATVIDFGLDTSSHLGALQYAIREELVTPQELDAAMGKGEKLTEIAQRGENPYRFVTFRTAWDDMPPEPEEYPTPEEAKSLATEIRADEHAARVRDYGEADAANYGQRVAEGAATVRHLESPPEPIPDGALEQAIAELEHEWVKPGERFKAILEGDSPALETPTNQPERGKER